MEAYEATSPIICIYYGRLRYRSYANRVRGRYAGEGADASGCSSIYWTGCYVGVNAGGGWGEHTGDRGIINSGNGTLNAGTGAPVALDVGSSGVIGGGQADVTIKLADFVFGIETDIEGSSVRGSSTIFFPSPNGGITDATTANGTER